MLTKTIYERSLWYKDTNSRNLARLQDFGTVLSNFMTQIERPEELAECFKATWVDKARLLMATSYLLDGWQKAIDAIPKPKGRSGMKRWMKIVKQREAFRARIVVLSLSLETKGTPSRNDAHVLLQYTKLPESMINWVFTDMIPPTTTEV